MGGLQLAFRQRSEEQAMGENPMNPTTQEYAVLPGSLKVTTFILVSELIKLGGAGSKLYEETNRDFRLLLWLLLLFSFLFFFFCPILNSLTNGDGSRDCGSFPFRFAWLEIECTTACNYLSMENMWRIGDKFRFRTQILGI